MTDDQPMTLVWYALVAILVLSALSARRLTFGMFLRSVIGWIVIAGILYVAVDHRGEIREMAARIGIGDQSVEGGTTRIRQSADGHFWAHVTLNGVERRMLIDSGATVTAISSDTARAAGIDTGGPGFPVLLSTANGTITAKRATIDRVSLGNLEADGLSAVVAPNFGDLDVIGMNFLSRVGSWRVEGDTLILEPKQGDDDETDTT